MLDFVVHAPVPYRHRSAGFRALYRLADSLQARGQSVAIAPLPMRFLAEFEDPCPFDLKSADLFSPAERRSAVHVVPEGVGDPPAEKSVRWLLNKPIHLNGEQFLEVDWWGQVAPRLCVDVIEAEFFYPKTEPGEGLLVWGGKYGSLGHSEQEKAAAEAGLFPREITQAWPASRKEMGDLLRSVEGIISYDPISSVNLESTICGTPVLMARGEMPPETIFGLHGYCTDPNDYFDANESAKLAAEHYESVRKRIAKDVDIFIAMCEERWG